MSINYNLIIEVARRDDPAADASDAVLDALVDYHPALSVSPRGWWSVTITLPAESLRQAITTGLAVVEEAAGVAVSVTAMTTDEFDLRAGLEPTSESVTVAEAAELLGVTRQAVLAKIKRGTLPGVKVGRDYVLPRQALGKSA